LNRPEKRNGLDREMFEALVARGEEIARDVSVRCVVLRGVGKGFCAGLDWLAFLSMGTEAAELLAARDPARSPANFAQRACWIWRELPVPVVAAVHGAALGGGLQLALACDIRIVAKDAQLSAMEVKYGLIPDMTATATLLRLVRDDLARELIYTGRVVDGDEAVRLGLCTRVADDPMSAARELARTIAAQSPEAVRAAKQLCERAPGLPIDAAFRLETELQLRLLGTPNQIEAVQAAMGKRAANFG
jgi:enoyl-CoA hydratase/carnithine racemase